MTFSIRHQNRLRPGNSGYSLAELALVAVILGILATMLLPRWFNTSEFAQARWFDELLQATRFAQKFAVASNCPVRVIVDAGGYSIQRPTVHCDTGSWQVLRLPASDDYSSAPSGVSVVAGTGAITFFGNGLASADHVVVVDGARSLSFTVYAATGYVERMP